MEVVCRRGPRSPAAAVHRSAGALTVTAQVSTGGPSVTGQLVSQFTVHDGGDSVKAVYERAGLDRQGKGRAQHSEVRRNCQRQQLTPDVRDRSPDRQVSCDGREPSQQ